MAMTLTIVVFCQTALLSESTRYDEARQSLSTAITQAIEDLRVSPTFEITTDEELCLAFINRVSTYIDSNSNVQFQILTADAASGLLDVVITERFAYSTGKTNDISLRKTVIIDTIEHQ